MKPLLKWVGGKSRLLNLIVKECTTFPFKRVVEPFAGSVSLSLALDKPSLINDLNFHLINLYIQVQSGLERKLDMKPEFYYRYRDRFNELTKAEINNRESAELFYYLNKTGFNGLCRYNSKGFFNVPKGSYKTINYINSYSEYTKAFANWEFYSEDFSSLKIKQGDLLYIDPPYDDGFTQYTKEGFSWEDQVRLVIWLSNLSNPTIVSNKNTIRIKELYKNNGFTIKEVQAPRSISRDGNRSSASELLMIRV